MTRRIITINVMHGFPEESRLQAENRQRALFRYLRQLDPDIIHFQEITYAWQLEAIGEEFAMDYNGFWTERIHPDAPGGPAAGLVTVVKAREWATKEAFADLRGLFIEGLDDPQGTFARLRLTEPVNVCRGMLMVRLGDGTLSVNLHFTPNFNGDWGPDNPYGQVHRLQTMYLAQCLVEWHISEQLIIVAGDANIATDSIFYQEFLKAARAEQDVVRDLFEDETRSTFRMEFLPGDRHPHRIDWFLLGGYGCASKRPVTARYILDELFKVNGRKIALSDHLGLLVEL